MDIFKELNESLEKGKRIEYLKGKVNILLSDPDDNPAIYILADILYDCLDILEKFENIFKV